MTTTGEATRTLTDQAVNAVHAMWHAGDSREQAQGEAVRRLGMYLHSLHLWAPRWLVAWTCRPVVKLGYQAMPERDCCG